jgi:hypothetical protein
MIVRQVPDSRRLLLATDLASLQRFRLSRLDVFLFFCIHHSLHGGRG